MDEVAIEGAKQGSARQQPGSIQGLSRSLRYAPMNPHEPECLHSPLRRPRIPAAGTSRFSRAMTRWNSSGIGGCQVHSFVS
jgi:hypothetical protein